MILLYSLVVLFGLVIGSFLNVCIYRIPREESIVYPSSHCMKCGTRLKFYDLIPVLSYITLRGKCRYCKDPISPRYMMVEIISAGVFTSLFNIYGMTIEFVAGAFLMSVLIAVFFIDIDHKIIPDGLTITAIIGGAALYVYHIINGVAFYGDRLWYTPLLGILVGSGTLLVVAIIGMLVYKTDDAMGMGDVKIFAPIGLFLGWKLTLLTLFLSIIMGAVIGVFLLATGLKKRQDVIPFGPFIVLGVLISLLKGWDIISSYMQLYL